jgi:hypothetical protein
MDTKELNKTGTMRAYNKDKQRLDQLKWHFAKKKHLDVKLSEQELIHEMTNYIYDRELNK